MEAMLFEGRLRTRDPSVKEYLHVYADDADNGDSTNNTVCYDLIISATNRSERIHRKIDTSWVHLGPANPNTVAGDEVYPLKLKQIRLSSRERGDTIFFLKKGALLSFQQLITGNRVVHDLSGVTITCQYSRNPEKRWKVWEGVPITEKGRVQLWKIDDSLLDQHFDSTSSKGSGSRRRDSSSTLTTTMTRSFSPSTISIPSIDSMAPQLPQLGFSSTASTISDVLHREHWPESPRQDQTPTPSGVLCSGPEPRPGLTQSDRVHHHSHSIQDDVSSLSTASSPFPEAQAGTVSPLTSRLSVQQSIITSAYPSLSNRSRTTSRPLSTRPSSVTSGGGISVISLDMKGKKGTIIQTPEAPSLVLLRRDGLLLIDINNDIETDPSLCDCERERKESASPSCTVVVLKTSEEGPKDIPARRTPSSTGLSGSGTEWNLAAAGRSQRKIPGCLEDVKHLRLLALDFKSVHDRLQFVQYFENLKTIYLRKLQGKW